MEDMLKRENIQIVEGVKDWVEAVTVGVQPLIDTGYVEDRYREAILENTQQFGPYYVLCEDFALLHASVAQGVIQKQLAITVLRKPVKFKPDGYDVRLLVTLAATDSESHLQAMQAISNIFTDEKRIQELVHASSVESIYEQFINAAKHE